MTETLMATGSKSEQAYAAVKARIVDGTYSPATGWSWPPSPRTWASAWSRSVKRSAASRPKGW
ncbi:transcriptional regulator protein [Arthrobacter sp. Hiyo4]|nr:transcriptional regulator protein [Arthrobacter sp. Hiyo4]